MFKFIGLALGLLWSLFLAAAPVVAAEDPPALQVMPAGEQALEDFLWQSRVLVVFADSEMDPRYIEQLEFLAEGEERLIERDLIVLTDTDPDTLSPIRKELRPRGFMIVLIGKDGLKYLRKPFPWDARELSRSIDKMPVRQQELADRRLGR